jgi:hypothetical protein
VPTYPDTQRATSTPVSPDALLDLAASRPARLTPTPPSPSTRRVCWRACGAALSLSDATSHGDDAPACTPLTVCTSRPPPVHCYSAARPTLRPRRSPRCRCARASLFVNTGIHTSHERTLGLPPCSAPLHPPLSELDSIPAARKWTKILVMQQTAYNPGCRTLIAGRSSSAPLQVCPHLIFSPKIFLAHSLPKKISVRRDLDSASKRTSTTPPNGVA